MQEEASALGIHLRTLVEAPDGSAAQVTVDAPVGGADEDVAVRALVDGRDGAQRPGAVDAVSRQAVGRADALTFEHEHQDSALLERLQAEGVSVQPTAQALLLARDKLAMRRAVDEAGLPQPAWAEAAGDADAMMGRIRAFAARHGWPVVLKTPRGGYDGHGVLLVDGPGELVDGEHAGDPEALGHRAPDPLRPRRVRLLQARSRGDDLGADAAVLDGLRHRPDPHLPAGAAGEQDGELAGEGDRLLDQQAGDRAAA